MSEQKQNGSRSTIDGNGKHASENCRLLPPSNENGTVTPLLERNGTIASETVQDRNKNGSLKDKKSTRPVMKRNLIVSAFVLLLGVVMVLRNSVHEKNATPFHLRRDKKNGIDHDVILNKQPLSLKDPVKDLSLPDYPRPSDSQPRAVLTSIRGNPDVNRTGPFPTNAWYQNVILVEDEPSNIHRTYTVPYAVDASGPIPGLRLHSTHTTASSDVVQVVNLDEYGLTVGAFVDTTSQSFEKDINPTHRYRAQRMTNLGVTLDWVYFPMTSSIVKGMPYGTMLYEQLSIKNHHGDSVFPTIASDIKLAISPIADRAHSIHCDSTGSKTHRVKTELELLFKESDLTWLVFFSEPVIVRCVIRETSGVMLQVLDAPSRTSDSKLIIRIALYKDCTTGNNPIYCHQELMHPTALLLGQGEYGELIRKHSRVYPGPDTKFDYKVDDEDNIIHMMIDWDAKLMNEISYIIANETSDELISFALPHHFDSLNDQMIFKEQIYCSSSLTGPACLVAGNKWNLTEILHELSFRAKLNPAPWSLEDLAISLHHDLSFRLAAHYVSGAGDTYFSGKQLAKFSRILLIAEELQEICMNPNNPDYQQACQSITLPNTTYVEAAFDALRSSVEVWLNGSAVTPFIFDSSWGGVVSCGCNFHEGKCKDRYPDCPAFSDPGLNFGNGFYNDMHFHYGYHIFACAVVSHFDPEWGRRYFQQVLLLVRSIANPSEEDRFFPTWRHKDWYQGSSWASGIARPYLNGKNQESSSEAIAAYEAIGLYGKVMSKAFAGISATDQKVAIRIREIGEVMTATELKSARTYWHVSRSPEKPVKIYPTAYQPKVVGIVWEMMAQFQTWFGRLPYLVYGIQLLPLTPVSELRDDVVWVKEFYLDFSSSCESDFGCNATGWSVLQMAMLASAGHPVNASQRVIAMKDDIFTGPAGNGHSRTNTLWYISTRPSVDRPIDLSPEHSTHKTPHSQNFLTNCHRPGSCTDFILDTIAGLYSCRQRMEWLIHQMGKSQRDACTLVASEHSECLSCDPNTYNVSSIDAQPRLECPPCTQSQCESDLNRCPRYARTYVCTEGANVGGCSGESWFADSGQCGQCCELSSCLPFDAIVSEIRPAVEANSSDCPVCPSSICRSRTNLCPKSGSAPFLCYEGPNLGGCAPKPWHVDESGGCHKCCKVTSDC